MKRAALIAAVGGLVNAALYLVALLTSWSPELTTAAMAVAGTLLAVWQAGASAPPPFWRHRAFIGAVGGALNSLVFLLALATAWPPEAAAGASAIVGAALAIWRTAATDTDAAPSADTNGG